MDRSDPYDESRSAAMLGAVLVILMALAATGITWLGVWLWTR